MLKKKKNNNLFSFGVNVPTLTFVETSGIYRHINSIFLKYAAFLRKKKKYIYILRELLSQKCRVVNVE